MTVLEFLLATQWCSQDLNTYVEVQLKTQSTLSLESGSATPQNNYSEIESDGYKTKCGIL